jgi:hypothetical protein
LINKHKKEIKDLKEKHTKELNDLIKKDRIM